MAVHQRLVVCRLYPTPGGGYVRALAAAPSARRWPRSRRCPGWPECQLTVGTEVQSYLLLGGHYIGSPEQIGPQSHVGHLARVLVHIEKIVEKTRFPVAVQIVGIPVARIVGKQINAVPVLPRPVGGDQQRDRKS